MAALIQENATLKGHLVSLKEVIAVEEREKKANLMTLERLTEERRKEKLEQERFHKLRGDLKSVSV